MEDARPEEKSPLLLYLVEGDGNVSKNNKRVNFDKGRLYGISSGATAVFTDFPNYISPCWITTLLSSLIFFMIVLLMVSSMVPSTSFRVPRCTHSNPEELSNATIHLVHQKYDWTQEQLELLEKIQSEYGGYEVHLLLLEPWDVPKGPDIKALSNANQLSVFQNISEPVTASLSVSTVEVNRALNEIKKAKRSKKNMRNMKRKKREHIDKVGPIGIGFGVKSLLDILLRSRVENVGMMKRNANDTKLLPNLFNFTELFPTTTKPAPRPKTLQDIIQNFPALVVHNATLEKAFFNTPLQKSWFKLNQDLTIFALRVLQLWQYGGLSFKIDGGERLRSGWEDVDNFSVAPDIGLQKIEPYPLQMLSLPFPPTSNRLLNFILGGRRTFESQRKDVVAADDEGLHFFTKTPCHAFFGEVLMNLKHARGDETPKRIIQKSLKVFCKHSAVGNNYCRHLFKGPVQF